MSGPVAIVKPDEKGRVALRRWLSGRPDARYTVTVDDGRIVLEEVRG
ncbi:hypothetical protein [Agromyces larvae]|uniref:Uncharacterized protein n=1 Tax=Agromyces larvae TaxID=2929802 RepID=A0ABY4C425_9MICO|nr:hypothetical protein [Agromyces larvae]UOE45969.1 hypothetical protein MTO99_09570 [Agromyces larvae]